MVESPTLSEAFENSLNKVVCQRIGEVLEEAISEWDVRHVINQVLTPAAKELLEQELAKPETQELLRTAIVGALKRSLPSIKIEVPYRHY
jgi:hypothetical protein